MTRVSAYLVLDVMVTIEDSAEFGMYHSGSIVSVSSKKVLSCNLL